MNKTNKVSAHKGCTEGMIKSSWQGLRVREVGLGAEMGPQVGETDGRAYTEIWM